MKKTYIQKILSQLAIEVRDTAYTENKIKLCQSVVDSMDKVGRKWAREAFVKECDLTFYISSRNGGFFVTA